MSWKYQIRLWLLQMILIVLCALLLYRLWVLQIVNGEQYAMDYELKITRTVRESNTRGLIYDCNGEILAYNELVFTVTMVDDGEYASKREKQLSLNSMIYRVICKLASQHEKVNNELKIEVGADGNYEYTVTGNALLRFQADVLGIADVSKMTSEQRGMSAEDMVGYLAGNQRFALYGEGKDNYTGEALQAYGLPEAYTKEEALAVVGIRYMLSANAYRRYVPVTIARDVSEETAAYIMENNQSLMALININVIRLQELDSSFATDLERDIAGALQEKYSEAMERLQDELLEGYTDFQALPEEMQEYLSYLIDEKELVRKETVNMEDTLYREWERKSDLNIKEFLLHAMDNGWIASEFIDTKQRYLSMDEMYSLLIEGIKKRLDHDIGFQKLLFKWLLMEEQITGREVCLLLYAQGVLSDMDNDYVKLSSGGIDAFSFLKKKIEQTEITPAMLALDPCSASAAVVCPENGKVLALVSYPGYDNNRLANQMDAAYYNSLLNDASLPLYNRATQQLTAPGSTFKPITVIAGMQEGVISPDSAVFCDGIFDKVEPVLKCWKHSGHGNVGNVETALQFSCNDYLCEIAYKLGMGDNKEYTDAKALHTLQEYAGIFYLDEKSGVEIAESEPHLTDAYAIPSAIGQGTHNYTTVQLARYVNIVAAKGEAYPLSLIEGITDVGGNFVEVKKPPGERVELPDTVWDATCLGMQQFAQSNAAFRDMGIPLCGKTGTAQEAKNRPDHALFVGYAPADTAEIAIAVRIANGYGSSNVTTIGRAIFDYYFDQVHGME